MRKGIIAAIAATIGVLVSATAHSEDYPTKPISIVVGYTPGGGLDLTMRYIAPYLEKELGSKAPVVVMNQPGAGGIIANTAVAKAPPDGYTLSAFAHPALMGAIMGEAQKPYTMKSYDFISVFSEVPMIIYTKNDSSFASLKDVLSAAAADPGGVAVGGVGRDFGFLGIKLMEKIAGITVNYIPSNGPAEVSTQVLGGHVPLGVGSLPAVSVVRVFGTTGGVS